MKKISAKGMKRKLHELWANYVKDRDKHTCQWCGRQTGMMNAHHIVAKGVCKNAGSYEVENGMCLCFQCHSNIGVFPERYVPMRDKWLKDRGLDYYELLAKYYETHPKMNQEFYDLKYKIISDMSKEIK